MMVNEQVMDNHMSGIDKTAAAKTPTDRSTTERRARGFAAVAGLAKDPLRRAAGKRGIAETRLLTHWLEIAGERLAAIARPAKVKPRGGHALGGVLLLTVEGARASEVEHEAPQIIERVNAFYGYAAIAEVQLLRASGPLPPLEHKAGRRPIRLEDLPQASRQRVEAITSPIEDDALRSALSQLGANVMAKSAVKGAKPSQKR